MYPNDDHTSDHGIDTMTIREDTNWSLKKEGCYDDRPRETDSIVKWAVYRPCKTIGSTSMCM